ncbi:MAG: hypothetical protein R3Y64_11415 [Peptostreptococcaceae bacterium]
MNSYQARDFTGFKELLISELKRRIPEYVDMSESDLGVILIESLALALDVQSYYMDMVSNESTLHTARDRGNVTELCNNLGYTIRNATPSVFKQVFNVMNSPLETKIGKGTKLLTKDIDNTGTLMFETKEDLIIPPLCSGLEKDEEGEYKYSVLVEEGLTINEEVLGSVQGGVDEVFTLWNTSVIIDSIKVYVRNEVNWEKWERVDNFIRSSKDDKHYTIRIGGDNKCAITFGNGYLGAVPSKGVNNVMSTYRIGGGTKGNIAPNMILNLENPRADVLDTFNPYICEIEGEDKESIDTAKRNALIGLNTLERAVTIYDFENIGLKYIPWATLIQPFEDVDGYTVSVYIANKQRGMTEEEFKYAIQVYEETRMLGVKVEIKDAEYIPLNFTLTIAKLEKDTTDYEGICLELIQDFFEIGNFDFEQRFSQSRLLKFLLKFLPSEIQDLYLVANEVPTLREGQLFVLGEVGVVIDEV